VVSMVAEGVVSMVAEGVVSMVAEGAVSMVAAEAEDTAVSIPSQGLSHTRPTRTNLPGARYGTAM
jgi:hypothetical protein